MKKLKIEQQFRTSLTESNVITGRISPCMVILLFREDLILVSFGDVTNLVFFSKIGFVNMIKALKLQSYFIMKLLLRTTTGGQKGNIEIEVKEKTHEKYPPMQKIFVHGFEWNKVLIEKQFPFWCAFPIFLCPMNPFNWSFQLINNSNFFSENASLRIKGSYNCFAKIITKIRVLSIQSKNINQ